MTQYKNNIVILAGWSIDNINGVYFIPQTHFVYLMYICDKFDNVVLISSTQSKLTNDENKIKLQFTNIRIIELPHYGSFLGSVKYFHSFYKAIKSVKEYNKFYCRVPDPFSWMPRLLFKKNCIMHFVGNPIEGIWMNKESNILKKVILTLLYSPDLLLTILACYKSKVFTNGPQISSKLRKIGVDSQSVISSILTENDFVFCDKNLDSTINLLFVGYLREQKGLRTIIKLIESLESEEIDYRFDIIGDGVLMNSISEFVTNYKINTRVFLHGHINDRTLINKFIDSAHLFIFPSLTEGSPRVILEVMSRNLPVISTPVGSLPYCFVDEEDIVFCNFNDHIDFLNRVIWARNNYNQMLIFARNAYRKVKNQYTQEFFLSKIFNS